VSSYGCPDNWVEANISLCTEEVWGELFDKLKDGEYRIISSTASVSEEGIGLMRGYVMLSPIAVSQLKVV